MNCKNTLKNILPVMTAILFLKTGAQLHANPYAAGVTYDVGTTSISFFVTENADNVKVITGPGAGVTNDLGALTRGKYTFALGTNTLYKIAVLKASGAGYKSADGTGTNAVVLQVSSDTNRYINLSGPRGLKVNRNPSSPYFGRIYAGNGLTAPTGNGRTMTRGIYMLNPDLTSAHGVGSEDTALTGGLGMTGTSFPYELAIGTDDNLYVCDWTDSTGNLWVTDPNVSDGSGFPVLKLLSAANTAKVPVGSANTHGSVNAAAVEGSLAAGNLTVYTIDEDLQTDTTITNQTELDSLWSYSVSAGPLPYTTFPTKLWTATGKQGIANLPQTSDMVRGANGYFYIIDNRSAGNESGLAIVSSTGTPLWNSWDQSQLVRVGVDILANSYKVAVSGDLKFIAVARNNNIVWIMPLTNGLPDLTQRLILNAFPGSGTAANMRGIAFDAANNLYVSNNRDEYIRVFSPGGTTVATTGNDITGTNGTFSVTAPATTVTVIATVPSITESGGISGVFTITRAGDLSVPLSVPYTISGTASNTVDYNVPSGPVSFAIGQASTNISVAPINDSISELTETVGLSLSGGSGYSVGSPGSATISILDDETPEVSVDPVAVKKFLESYASSRATFVVTRRGLLTPALTVNLAYGGTATRSVDYTAPATVSFAANAATASVSLAPLDDQIYEGDETVIVTAASGTGYNVGAANGSTAILIDDEYPAGMVLFSDNFETDSSLLWNVFAVDTNDAFADFAYNYSLAGIPPAPGTSTTLGMRFRLSQTINEINAITAAPIGGNFGGDYRLKFNMWINYNGPLPDGGPGSTQNFVAGVGTTGDHVNWDNTPNSDGIWFTTTGDGADGNTGGDYDAYIGSTIQNDDTGFYAAGTGPINSGIRSESNPYYAIWGGVTAPSAQLALFPKQTGIANPGNAGMAWHTFVVTKAADTVSWTMDGVPIATVTNDPSYLSTNIFVGYQDIFSSGSISDVPAMSFGLLDNLRVETVGVAITGIALVGGNVEITFASAPVYNETAFALASSSTVAGVYPNDNTASIVKLGPGVFKATVTKNGNQQFYRIAKL